MITVTKNILKRQQFILDFSASVMASQDKGSHPAQLAQFIAVCRRSKWSKHVTNSPIRTLLDSIPLLICGSKCGWWQ